jgi:hypothetical protein
MSSILIISLASSLSACGLFPSDIHIEDARIATAIDENFMPVSVTDVFPKGTTKVSCWIKWRDSRINARLIAKWHYITDDIHIIDRLLTIPKREGMGSVTLSMPEGKDLPSGYYKVDLVSGNRILKSLKFKVE